MSCEESPVEWCERMQREAETGEDGYHYYQLKQQWEQRLTNEESEKHE